MREKIGKKDGKRDVQIQDLERRKRSRKKNRRKGILPNGDNKVAAEGQG